MSIPLLIMENAVFSRFAFYSVIVIVKTMIMSLITTKKRFERNVFVNPEDLQSTDANKGEVKTIANDPVVERFRRCHLNDLENVIPFVLVGVLYVTTDPDPWWATLYFRTFTVSRLLHTVCYLFPLPQPSRALMFVTGWMTTFAMAVSVLRNAQY